MKTALWRLCLAAYVGLVSMSALWVPVFAQNPPSAAKQEIPNQALEQQLPSLEPIHVDTQRPAIPLQAVRSLNRDSGAFNGMTMDEAKETLQQLMSAQQKIMQQMELLQARIEKTEAAAQDNHKQLQASNAKQTVHGDMLKSLANRTYLTGYVESGWRTYNHAPRTEEFLDANGKRGSSFDMRKVIIRPHMNFTDKATWYTEVEFEDGLNEVGIEESVFNYSYKPWLNMKTGMMVLPYTHTSWNHDGPLRMLVDRPLVDQYVIPSTYNDLGAGITGMIPLFKHSGINYELDVINGLTDTIGSTDANTRVSNSIDFQGLRPMRPGELHDNTHFRDTNSNKTLFGKVGFSPFPGLLMNVSSSMGKIDRNNRVGLHIVAGDIQYRHKKFALLGEYATAIFSHKVGISSQGIPFSLFPNSLRGCFLQLSYDLTPKLAAISAFNYVNMDTGTSGNKMQRYSAGLRYNPFGNVFLKAEYQHSTPRGQFQGKEHSSDAILTQLTFYYR